MWVDGKQVIDAWGPHDSATSEASAVLTAGRRTRLRIEYLQLGLRRAHEAAMAVGKIPGPQRAPPGFRRATGLTPGTAKSFPVPARSRTTCRSIETPIWIKSGAVLPLAPEMQYTGEKPWDPVTLDCYPCAGKTSSATLYEDDTLTTAYQRGEFRNTPITVAADETAKTVHVEIGAAKGSFQGAPDNRAWVLRIHPPADWPKNPAQVTINGKKINLAIRWLKRDAAAMPLGDPTGAPDGDVFEISLPATPVSQSQSVEISLKYEKGGGCPRIQNQRLRAAPRSITAAIARGNSAAAFPSAARR